MVKVLVICYLHCKIRKFVPQKIWRMQMPVWMLLHPLWRGSKIRLPARTTDGVPLPPLSPVLLVLFTNQWKLLSLIASIIRFWKCFNEHCIKWLQLNCIHCFLTNNGDYLRWKKNRILARFLQDSAIILQVSCNNLTKNASSLQWICEEHINLAGVSQ